jgi:putative N6-adenine-specific DNA methylase
MASIFDHSSQILITCPLRLAPYLAREVAALGFADVKEYPAGVELTGTLNDALRLNLHVRTGTRALFQIGKGRVLTPADLYRLVAALPWERFIHPDGYFSVVSSVDTPEIDNTMFANMKCKDAIVDRIRAKTGRRPDSGSDTTFAVVYLYWHGSYCAVYIDTSGEPLTRRGWRKMPAAAPMRETLAAAVLQASRWNSASGVFVNPMCGSGTLAIEAALLAQNKPSVWARTNFGFMHLQGYKPELWESLRHEAKRQFADVKPGRFVASDNSPKALEATRRNAATAGVGHLIETKLCDFAETRVPDGEGVVALNPGYGERIGEEHELEDTYRSIGDFFKQHCEGKYGYIFTGNPQLAKSVGLRPKRRIEFFNADIDCRLVEYELYAGSRKR